MLDMRKGVCAVCSHTEIIDAPALDWVDEDNATPVAVTHAPDAMNFLQPTSALSKPYGVLRMLVCRSCGFVQWFASRPHRIPIDDGHGTKLIKGDAATGAAAGAGAGAERDAKPAAAAKPDAPR